MGKVRSRFGVIGILGVVVVAAMTAGGVALAGQGSDERARSHTAAAGHDPTTFVPGLLELRDDFVRDVARELGEEPPRLQAAVRTVVARWVDRFVDAGFLSERNAEALMSCWDARECDPKAVVPPVP